MPNIFRLVRRGSPDDLHVAVRRDGFIVNGAAAQLEAEAERIGAFAQEIAGLWAGA